MLSPRISRTVRLCVTLLAVCTVAVGLSACAAEPARPAGNGGPPTQEPTAEPGEELCGPGSAVTFVSSDFQAAPTIDNRWLPLEPGMQYTLEGTVTSADGVQERRVVHTVTGLSKLVHGVPTRVLWDRDYTDGELAESELAFFAQTDQGAVWLLGEYPEEYEDGEFVGAPSTFLSGVDGATAGIIMPASPRIDTPAHVQAHAPSVDFLDCASVFRENQNTCVPAGCYEDVLIIDETNPLEPTDGHQRKSYFAGVGNVQVTAEGGADREELGLITITKLSQAELDAVNAEALSQDERGYTVSPDVYGTAPRAVAESSGT